MIIVFGQIIITKADVLLMGGLENIQEFNVL
jgi:hypothetical protein